MKIYTWFINNTLNWGNNCYRINKDENAEFALGHYNDFVT